LGVWHNLYWKREKPCYLSIVTDAYSKKIMGYYVAVVWNTESSVKALNMAIKKSKETPLIHHSDRGYNIVQMIKTL
jgi:transposase InsO family protein